MTRPSFLTSDQAKEAFEAFVLPSIENAIKGEHVGGKHFHVVTLIPGIPYSADADLPILFEYSRGREEWENWSGKTFKDFAEAKVRLTWRTGFSSRLVAQTMPQLFQSSDTRYWGSDIIAGFPTGFSGFDECFDEMYARMNSAAIAAEASYYADKHLKDEGIHFI